MPEAGAAQRRWVTPAVVGVVCLLVGGLLAWVLLVVLRPADDPLDTAGFMMVEVAPGEVGSSIRLNAIAEWSPVPAGANEASGVVTAVRVRPGDEVDQGAVSSTRAT